VASGRNAGAKVTSAFVTELLLTNAFDVAEPGNFARSANEVLRAQGGSGDLSQMSAADLAALGDNAGVQGILIGTVREYEMARVGQEEFPLVSIDLRLVDAPTGNLIWMASVTRRGGPNLPFISVGETHTLGEMTEKVCAELAGSLADHAK
jgi:curli biogenesis system outer membrane secretion channel CsgG